jgi:hypothetical protein
MPFRNRTRLPARDAARTVAADPTSDHDLSKRITALNELTARQLRDEWRDDPRAPRRACRRGAGPFWPSP